MKKQVSFQNHYIFEVFLYVWFEKNRSLTGLETAGLKVDGENTVR